MRSIAERLVLRQTATAQRDNRSASKTIRISFRILDLEVALNANGSVVDNCHFCGHANRW